MTSGDCLVLFKQLLPDGLRQDASILNFIDRANKRIVKKLMWPDCWMTTTTVPNQQEYISLPIIKVNAVYVGGQLATQTDRPTLEGRQIDLYDMNPAPQSAFIANTQATGSFQVVGPFTLGDTLTALIGGVPVPVTVGGGETQASFVAKMVSGIAGNPFLQPLVTVAADAVAGKIDITAVSAGVGGNAITLSATSSLGATETWTASGTALAGGQSGSGGAPGTIGAYAPTWATQEPLSYPVAPGNNFAVPGTPGAYWPSRMRPNAEPWAIGQPPRYYWRGGSIAVVPSPLNSPGVTIAIDCVRQPDTIVTANQVIVGSDITEDAIVFGALELAKMSDPDTRSLQQLQIFAGKYVEAMRELIAWRNGFEGSEPKQPRMQTQRYRTGRTGLYKR
jgi:hypothetical protein